MRADDTFDEWKSTENHDETRTCNRHVHYVNPGCDELVNAYVGDHIYIYGVWSGIRRAGGSDGQGRTIVWRWQ